MPHKGTHSRGYLPHRDYPCLQLITFRLADSVPAKVITSWRHELTELLNSPDEKEAQRAAAELHRRIARYEDTGHGTCHLRIPEIATIVQDKLKEEHTRTYHLLEWTVMPNHVHALIRVTKNHPLGTTIQKWKGGSALLINRHLNRRGKLWALDYHDRFIRNEAHLHNARRYIHHNPVKAGLCEKPENWPLSSIGSIGSIGSGWNPDPLDREL